MAGHAWSCSFDDGGIRFASNGPINFTAGLTSSFCHVAAVVSPALGKRVSHVVVGATGSRNLLVLSLPAHVLVHTHTLTQAGFMGVSSLAADPRGEALVVSCIVDDIKAVVHVLPWPLPGMPPLE